MKSVLCGGGFHGEHVPGVTQQTRIYMGQALSGFQPLAQMPQLDAQDGGQDFVEAAAEPFALRDSVTIEPGNPCRAATALIRCKGAGCPKRWTGMMHRVWGPMAAAISSGSISNVCGSTSTNRGVVPAARIAATVGAAVLATVITSPDEISNARKAMVRASVPDFTPTP